MKYEKPVVEVVNFKTQQSIALLNEDLQRPIISGESSGPRDPNHTN